MLTETKAKNIKQSDRPVADGTVTGLRLLPGKRKGRGKWQLRFVSPQTGKRRDMGLGVYPDTTIALARQLGSEARKLIAKGVDPIQGRDNLKLDKVGKNEVMTFEEAGKLVHKDLSAGWKNAKHGAQWLNTLKSYVFPKIGSNAISELKANDFANVLRPIWLTKSETASRVKQRCHTIMKWCFAKGLIVGNPVELVDNLLPKQPSLKVRVQHQPSMPWALIPTFVKNEIQTGSDVTRALLEFIIHTAVRSGEARAAKLSEIDFESKVWKIPSERMKGGIVHRVPLTERTIAILNWSKKTKSSGLIFPSPMGGTVLTDMALTKFLRDKKTASDVAGRHATAHGFRSSFRDWASENGYPRDLAERALAHTIKNQSEAAYHRTDLLEQRRPMMDAWSLHVSSFH